MKPSLLLLLAFLTAAFAQDSVTLRDNPDNRLTCAKVAYCEIRERTMPATGSFTVDGLQDGDVIVRGWARPDVQVRFRVSASAGNLRDARELIDAVSVGVEGGAVRVSGPDGKRASKWTVSAEVFVPQASSVRVNSTGGAVYVSDVRGKVEVKTDSGELEVERAAADVNAATQSGQMRLADIGGNVDYTAGSGKALTERVRGRVNASTRPAPAGADRGKAAIR